LPILYVFSMTLNAGFGGVNKWRNGENERVGSEVYKYYMFVP
jgi:hypothetical protein